MIPYVGSTHPGAVGWTRVGIVAGLGLLFVVLAVVTRAPASPVIAAIGVLVFGGNALWAWMRMSTRFVVDRDGITVYLGGFWRRPTIPLDRARTVQLRQIPAESLGASVGTPGWRRGSVLPAHAHEITPIGGRKVFTTGGEREPYRLLVSRPGTMVEVIGRPTGTSEPPHLLLSADDPAATAAAIDQVLRGPRSR